MATNSTRAKGDKPELGVPMCGVLTWAGAFPDKSHPPSIDLMITGVWENARQRQKGGGGPMMNPGTEADVWLPWKAAEALAKAGLIMQDAGDPTRFTPLLQQRFYIRRDEVTGSRAHNWTAHAIDQQGDAVTLEARPVPKLPPHPAAAPEDAPAAAQPAPPAGNGAPGGPGPAPGVVPAQGQQEPQKAAERDDLAVMREADALYRCCAAMSLHALMWLYRVPREEIYPRTAQAGCATLMIRLEHQGFKATHAAANTMRRLVDELDVEMKELLREREANPEKAKAAAAGSGIEELAGAGPQTKDRLGGDEWKNRPAGLGPEEDDDLPF